MDVLVAEADAAVHLGGGAHDEGADPDIGISGCVLGGGRNYRLREPDRATADSGRAG